MDDLAGMRGRRFPLKIEHANANIGAKSADFGHWKIPQQDLKERLR